MLRPGILCKQLYVQLTWFIRFGAETIHDVRKHVKTQRRAKHVAIRNLQDLIPQKQYSRGAKSALNGFARV